MYRATDKQLSVYDYIPPFHGELSPKNRWVRLAAAIDWDGFEKEYSTHFARGGKIAIPARVALGCLIIRAAYRASDRETVSLVRESPYLQYFLGCDGFCDEAPFSARSMEKFRTRIPRRMVSAMVRTLRGFEALDRPDESAPPPETGEPPVFTLDFDPGVLDAFEPEQDEEPDAAALVTGAAVETAPE